MKYISTTLEILLSQEYTGKQLSSLNFCNVNQLGLVIHILNNRHNLLQVQYADLAPRTFQRRYNYLSIQSALAMNIKDGRSPQPQNLLRLRGKQVFTSCINLLQTALISLLRVALNIITCFSCGVALKICCTSVLISKSKTR